MEAILRAIANLKERLDQLVDFTQPLSLRKKPENTSEILKRAVSKMEDAFESKRIKIMTRMPAHLPPVAVDSERMEVAFTHVLRNAM